MNRSLITFGFLRMMLPPVSSKPIVDPLSAAKMQRLIEDARWREYDFPAYRRFKRDRDKKPLALPVFDLSDSDLPGLLRRQAE